MGGLFDEPQGASGGPNFQPLPEYRGYGPVPQQYGTPVAGQAVPGQLPTQAGTLQPIQTPGANLIGGVQPGAVAPGATGSVSVGPPAVAGTAQQPQKKKIGGTGVQ